MNADEIKDKIIEKQDEIIRLLCLNDAYFDVMLAVLNDEVTVLKADLKSQLSEAGEENKSSHELQNERMRIWFQKRTGLIDAMLCTHMKKIDEMLSIDPVE